MDQETLKRRAAEAALTRVHDGVRLGVGTGSTVDYFIDALGKSGIRLSVAVSSSETTTRKLRAVGIDPDELNSAGDLDLYVDGADEATRHRHLIKGGGGALTREKIIAAASRQFVCIIDESKLVGTLGAFPLPIEVIPMARSYVGRQMVQAGGRPVWRQGVVTDNGNHLLDVHDLDILNPLDMEQRFNQIAGVVTVGLFATRPADTLLIATPDGIQTVE